jgi:RPA family protein
MPEQQEFKRNVAYKMRIGEILAGKVMLDGERFKFLESAGKQVVRTNLIANVIDKYIQDGEKKYASVTLDDGTGQIKLKAFGDDIEKFTQLNQGETVLIVGLLRTWNNEIYITPEIIKKKEPAYLLVRKLEIEKEQPKSIDKGQLLELKDKILQMVKDGEKDGGASIEQVILQLKESPDIINSEIKKLLEDGVVYEPRPGKIRYLG